MVRLLMLLFVLTTFGNTALAQDLQFDKKKNSFLVNGHAVALLVKGKAKDANGKNFYLTDHSGNHMLEWNLHHWQDTLGGNSTYYYSVEAPAKGWIAHRPNFANLNIEKELSGIIIEEQLLQAGGELNESNVQEYFKSLLSYGNIKDQLAKTNDSIAQLLHPIIPPVERNKNKKIVATEYGRLGQDDVEIGQWELLTIPKDDIGRNNNYMFILRNSGGGIVCVSHITLSGARNYYFAQGIRSEEERKVINLIDANPIANAQAQYAYVVELARQCILKKLL